MLVSIDLGQTVSSVGVCQTGAKPELVATIPTTVAIGADGVWRAGAAREDDGAIFDFHRLLGRAAADKAVRDAAAGACYGVEAGPHGAAWVKTAAGAFAPEHLCAAVLRELADRAREHLGEDVASISVTVPALFSDAQRQAVKDAARIAALDVVRMHNQGTAAGVGYGDALDDKPRTVAVLRWGGGGFDCTIMEIGDGVYEVLAVTGDPFLGGADIDAKLTAHLAEAFRSRARVDLAGDPKAMRRLRIAAETAKERLSKDKECKLSVPAIAKEPKRGTPLDLNMTVTRDGLDRLARPLIERTVTLMKAALKDCDKKPGDIHEIVCVGGAAQAPAFKNAAQNLFSSSRSTPFHAPGVERTGAILLGGTLTGAVRHIVPLDVISMSLGIETLGGVFTRLIPRNTTIPTKKSEIFSTAEDNQAAVTIRLFQGEREMAGDNLPLGQFDLVGIPPAPRGMPQIEVMFDVDANGIMFVSAKDKSTNTEQSMRANYASGLPEPDVQRFQAALAEAMPARSAVLEHEIAVDVADSADADMVEAGEPAPAAAPAAKPRGKKLFISYRRNDTGMLVGRIHDRLSAAFGAENLVFDIDSIPYGVDFRDHIRGAIEECGAMLAVIGEDWRGARGEPSPRIHNATDFVRLEIATAIALGVPIIPILVRPADMPAPDSVPAELADFCYRNAAPLDPGRDFHVHMDRIIRAVTPN